MNDTHTAALLAAHPTLFRQLRAFGFECDDGWYALLSQLCIDIDALARAADLQGTDSWPAVAVVKEKMGSLRVQGDFGAVADAARHLIDAALLWSTSICERCGGQGRTQYADPPRSWLKTCCLVCYPNATPAISPRPSAFSLTQSTPPTQPTQPTQPTHSNSL
jgi:hypothetical protein